MVARRIALFVAARDNDYQQALAAEAEAVAARNGFDLDVTFTGSGTGRISTEQAQQVFRALSSDPAQRPAVVMIFPLLDVAHMAKEVLATRIGLVILNQLPREIEDWRGKNPGLPIFAVSGDQVQAGRVQAQQLRRLVPDGGLVLGVLGPPLASSTADRAKGLREALEGSNFRLTTVNADWGAASGEEVVTKWLRQPWNKEPIRAIACQNDAMAVGARRASRALSNESAFAHLRRLPVLGIDGTPSFGMKLVDSGELTATVINPLVTGAAIDLLARAWKGETVPAHVTVEPKGHPAQLGSKERTQRVPKPDIR
jgi:ABC-type sugar transport system substrate-binding protein